MKTLKITLLIIVAFIFGAFTSHIYAQSIRLIEVPEYIGNYNTIDLLNYLSQLKAKEDSKVIQSIPTSNTQIYIPHNTLPTSTITGHNASA